MIRGFGPQPAGPSMRATDNGNHTMTPQAAATHNAWNTAHVPPSHQPEEALVDKSIRYTESTLRGYLTLCYGHPLVVGLMYTNKTINDRFTKAEYAELEETWRGKRCALSWETARKMDTIIKQGYGCYKTGELAMAHGSKEPPRSPMSLKDFRSWCNSYIATYSCSNKVHRAEVERLAARGG